MPATPAGTCRRCRQPLTRIYPGQTLHPLCSSTETGWIPQTKHPHPAPVALALDLAAYGWHILPLSPTSKRPLGNCPRCHDRRGRPPHRIEDCPCIPAGAWCHGVRAATADLDRITTWWAKAPRAVPGIAAGPSGLVLLDLDTHTTQQPQHPLTELLPGIDLAAEHITADQLAAVRDGRDTLLLLARVRGGPDPWPQDREHQPLVTITPSGGRHLWYRAPTSANLRQAIGELGWQIDIKAGWSYGMAPSAATTKGTYTITTGNPAAPGHMPDWLGREVIRTASRRPPPKPAPPPLRASGSGPAAYLTTVINRGAADLARLTDGRQRALSALAYKTGGLLAWSGLNQRDVAERLINAGTASGLRQNLAARIVHRSLLRGLAQPLPEPGTRR